MTTALAVRSRDAPAAGDGTDLRPRYRRVPRDVDASWWTRQILAGRPVVEVLRCRDIGSLFAFLRSRGWSRLSIAAATGLTESRVRAIAQGKQQVSSYAVLERIAEGLSIPRGWMGLAYTDPVTEEQVA